MYVNLTNCKYDVVYESAEELGWRPVFDDDNIEWNLFWTDTSVSTERVMRLQKFQKINHFPGMYQICRKGDLARSLTRIARAFPKAFRFFPRTWALPEHGAAFKAQLAADARSKSKKQRTYIVKPVASCQGKGIFLTRSWDDIDPAEAVVAQRYIANPLLIDGYKFDLRLYVLVTSCMPAAHPALHDGLVGCAPRSTASRPRRP